MSVFVTSTSSVNRHGVFAIEQTPPSAVVAIGTGVSALVGQFPWGPDSASDPLYLAESEQDRAETFAPAGMDRTGSGYLSMIRKAFPELRVVRVLGSAAAKASSVLANATPATVVTLTAKYKGTAGNSLVAVVSDASDGDALHFNLNVSITGASGYTEDVLQNLNYSGTGSDSVPDFTKCRLLGAITKSISSRPVNGTYTFSSGAEGTINAGRYVGTASSGNYGIAKLEGDKSVRHVFTDDPGNTDRAAVNAGLLAHAVLMGDRSAYICGNSGLSAAATKTDRANYSSSRTLYVAPWVYITDESGTRRLVPPTAFAASANSQLSPSTSLAWKNSEVQTMLGGIVDLESNFGEAIGGMSDAGVCVLIQEDGGGFTFESDNTTVTLADPARRKNKRQKMVDYIAVSFVRSMRGSSDAPNVAQNRDDLRIALDNMMSTLKSNQFRDPNHTPHVLDYAIPPDSAANSTATIGAGIYTLPLLTDLSPDMEKIFLALLASDNGSVVVREQ